MVLLPPTGSVGDPRPLSCLVRQGACFWGSKEGKRGASTPVTSRDLGRPLSSNSVGLGMGGTRPNPGTALRVVTFRQRQSFPRGDPGQVPAEGGQAAGSEEEEWDGWMGG